MIKLVKNASLYKDDAGKCEKIQNLPESLIEMKNNK